MAKDRGHTRIGNLWLRRGSPVKGNRLLVLLYLRSRANKADRCWPSIETIAADLGIGERTAKRAVADLEKLGLVLRFKDRAEGGQWERTIYEVADLRLEPGATVAHGPGATVARGPGATTRGHHQGPQWPTNNPQENKTQQNNPQESPAGVAHCGGETREIDPARDVPGWSIIAAYAKKAGISSGQIAEKIFEDVRPAYILGYLIEKLRKKPTLRKTPGAWFADKCNRKKAPPLVDYDRAKALLRPFLEGPGIPGLRFCSVLPSTGKRTDPKKGLREKLVRLELEAAAEDEKRALA